MVLSANGRTVPVYGIGLNRIQRQKEKFNLLNRVLWWHLWSICQIFGHAICTILPDVYAVLITGDLYKSAVYLNNYSHIFIIKI